ncbi:MAG: dihydroorotate dehydrogenase electron transfer subunit [Candidatus Nanopelagicales bacterium]
MVPQRFGKPEAGPIQVRGEVLAVRRSGDYHVLVFAAPGVAEATAPGNFVAIAVGGQPTAMLLRRCFSIHRVDTAGALGGTVEIVVDAHGPGTKWLVERSVGDPIDVIAPLGRPFSLPKDPVPCVLVGGGYGSAPLFMLADRLRERGCRVDLVLGAATESRLFGVVDGRRRASSLAITTDDGSLGTKGRVTDVLDRILDDHGGQVIYGCGPMGMLAGLAKVARERGIVSQCAVEEAMACGVGVCMTCVLPVIGSDGVTRMTRSCTDGPVFFGDQVRWESVGTVPPDCLGAPVSAPGDGQR